MHILLQGLSGFTIAPQVDITQRQRFVQYRRVGCGLNALLERPDSVSLTTRAQQRLGQIFIYGGRFKAQFDGARQMIVRRELRLGFFLKPERRRADLDAVAGAESGSLDGAAVDDRFGA